jgi:hypothetical protein
MSTLGRFCCKSRKSNDAKNLANVDFLPASAVLKNFGRQPKKTFATISAHLGHGAMSDLSPQCAQERTSLRGFALAANRLKQHRTPVEIKELLLAAGEHAHVDGRRSVDTHPKQRRAMRDG